MKQWTEAGFAAGVADAEVHDPSTIDSVDIPSPLSGEFAGQSIPEIFGSWEAATEEAMESYEAGYESGWFEVVNVMLSQRAEHETKPSIVWVSLSMTHELTVEFKPMTESSKAYYMLGVDCIDETTGLHMRGTVISYHDDGHQAITAGERLHEIIQWGR